MSRVYEGGKPDLALDVESHYLSYGPMALRSCRTLLRNPAKAEDAMQDVFVSLIRYEDWLREEAPGALSSADRHQRLPQPAARGEAPPGGRT